jgi:His-Xaa-Ser system protein HxsD
MADPITVEFSEGVQSLDALHAAAYRMLDVATCRIERTPDKLLCHLSLRDGVKLDGPALRTRFIETVTDEALRERLSHRVEPVRNLILSLAFGALAAQPDKSAG